MRRALLTAVLGVACSAKAPEPLALADGKELSSAELAHGRSVYLHNCYACHGPQGDGHGPSAATMRPPPRDFRQGLFKFGGVPAGALPTDEGLLRVLRRGLQGTPMHAWGLTEPERRAVVGYLKTFSARWREEAPGEAIAISADPWSGRAHEAIARGRDVYHLAAKDHAGCALCHPGYLPRAELADLTERVTGRRPTAFAPGLHRSRRRETDYPLTTDAKGEPEQLLQVLPPDFLFHRTKTVFDVGALVEGRRYSEADQREDLYRVIAAGVGGAAMPTWKGALSEENLWALAYYVQSLIRLRDTEEGRALRARLAADDAAATP